MNNSPTSDLAYRFEYADESAFEVYVDGRAFIVTKSGRREEKFGKIDNRIPSLLGRIAKPRQDEIDRLRAEVAALKSDKEILATGWESAGNYSDQDDPRTNPNPV